MSQNSIERSGNWQKVKTFSQRTTLRFIIEILRLLFLITHSEVTETFTSLFMFIGWWITWYGQKHFLALYCHFELFWIIEYLVSYTSHFNRHTPKISKIWISWKSSDPTGNYHIFSISVVKMTNFDPRYQRCSCDTSNWNQWAWNHYKIVLAENFHWWRHSILIRSKKRLNKSILNNFITADHP